MSAPQTSPSCGASKAPRRLKKDPDKKQRDKIYAWEGGWLEWNLNSLTLAECRLVVRTACRKFGVKHPTVAQHNKNSYSYYDADKHRISMQATGARGRGGKNRACCIHEAAHVIVHHKRPKVLDHGAYFAAVYLLLLAHARIAPMSALLSSARAVGIKCKL
jgi:hypothetical protein